MYAIKHVKHFCTVSGPWQMLLSVAQHVGDAEWYLQNCLQSQNTWKV